MATTTISSREFSHDVGGAQRAAEQGPVLITEGGQPAYVLLSHDAYQQLITHEPNLVELLSMPGVENVQFEPVPLAQPFLKAAELG